MKQQNLFLTCAISALILMPFSYLSAETIYYEDQTLHLAFVLDTETHEATLGTGTDDQHNAIAYPPIDDPWWEPSGFQNLWQHVVVPETIIYGGDIYTIVGVSKNAFYKETRIETVHLPNSIRNIGASAFGWSVDLKSVNIPEGVETIGVQAFELCRKLDTITLPSTILDIGGKAFFNCSGLKQINIPGNCNRIGDDAFTWCDSLETISFDDGYSPITLGYAYEFGLDFIKGFQYLHTHAMYSYPFYRGLFADCNLKNIYIGRNIILPEFYPGTTDIYSPFEDCYCTQYNETGKQYVQHEGKMLRRVEFGETVTSIPDYLLYKCTTNENITLPSNIQYIGTSSLLNCVKSQITLVIPASCDSIAPGAFSTSSGYSSELKYIICEASTPPALGGALPLGVRTKIPAGCGNLYRQNLYWRNTIIIDPSDQLVYIDVKYPGSLYGRLALQDLETTDVCKLKIKGTLNNDDIGVINSMSNLYELDMSECDITDISGLNEIAPRLSHIKFSNSITNIPRNFFSNSYLVDTLIIPASCSNIGKSAFWKSPIKHLIIEGSALIENSAFSQCKNLHTVEIRGVGASLQTESFYSSNTQKVIIGSGAVVRDDAFYYNKNLKELILADGVDSIYSRAFIDVKFSYIHIGGRINYLAEHTFAASALTLEELHIGNLSQWCKNKFLTIQSNPMSIAQNILYNNKEITDVILPVGVDSLGDYTFAHCSPLQYVHIPNTVRYIGEGVFSDCNKLDTIVMSDSLSYLGKKAFRNCSRLKNCKLPEKLTFINDSCFENCVSLSSINFPSKLQSICCCAFKNCILLDSLNLPLTLKSIGASAFYGCEGISSLNMPLSITSIDESAYAYCSNLKTIKAKWLEPITINTNTFDHISKKCFLLVPHNTVSKYYAAGWGHIPLIEEGFYVLIMESGKNGTISCDDFCANASIDALIIDMEAVPDEIVLTIEPDSSYYVKSLLLDSADVTSQISLQNHQISILNIQDNKSISAEFEEFELGDVNADDHIDVGDITSVVNYIQKNTVGTFIPEAADANQDKEIDVGDIVGEVNLIYDFANQATSRVIQKRKDVSVWTQNYHVYADEVILSENNEMTIPIYLENNTSVYGFQMEFELPESLSISISSDNSYMINAEMERLEDMNIYSIAPISEHHYQVLCASTNGHQIHGNEGAILYITLHADTPLDKVITIPVYCRLADKYGNVHKAEFDMSVQKQIQNPTNLEMIELETAGNNVIKVFENGRLMIIKDEAKYTASGMRVF